jgi:hypothetical protein
MKKKLLGKIKTAMVLSAMFICGYSANGQTANFVAPSAVPYIYPGSGGQEPTSCFAWGNLTFNGTPFDPYISAWGDRIVWRLAMPGSATSFGPQGQFLIPGATGMKVTMYNPGVPCICAVYKLGGSFYMRLYPWSTSSFTFVTGPTTLLTSAAGSRISIDAYGLGAVGIVWDEIQPVTFQPILKCKFSYGGAAFTGNYTLANTSGSTHPDIAMTRTGTASPSYLNNNTVHGHIVALSGPYGARVLTEYGIPVEDIIASNPAVQFNPYVEDVNNLGYQEVDPVPSIDCPDYGPNSFGNWAYTYVATGDVCGRFSDYTAGTITTAVLTNGSMGNFPITLSGFYYANHKPTITYNKTATSIFIGWEHSVYSASQNKAVCVEVTTDGSALISPLDYLYINSSQASSAPVFSKHTEYASYLYATTLELPFTTANMTHYFHNWSNNTSFKPGSGLGINNPMFTDSKIQVYPNPVTDNIKVTIPATLARQTLNVAITDVFGRVIYSSSCKSEQLGDALSKAFAGKASGTYLLNVQHRNSGFSQEEKLVKLH